jgi:hypothetical protein
MHKKIKHRRLIIAGMDIGLEVNVDKFKYMVISHNLKRDNGSV